MKKLSILSAVGLALGNFIATYFGPTFLRWWFESPVNMAVNCTDPIQWAMKKLIVLQTIGSIVGIVIGITAFFLFFKKSEPI